MSGYDLDANTLGDFSDYQPSDGGVTNGTTAYASAPPDASGGTGSFLSGLLPTLTNGLNAALNSAVLNKVGGQSSLYTVDAYGNLVPKAAAGANNRAYSDAVAGTQSALSSPVVLLAGLAAVGLLVYALVK